jgi:hypothetical protein
VKLDRSPQSARESEASHIADEYLSAGSKPLCGAFQNPNKVARVRKVLNDGVDHYCIEFPFDTNEIGCLFFEQFHVRHLFSQARMFSAQR